MQLLYSVAASPDGYTAGADGEYDWIPIDPEIDFEAMYAGFSSIVKGRRSYEVLAATGGAPDLRTTLPEDERGGITFVRDAVAHMRTLKASGGPVWLWGGGDLFRRFAEAGLVEIDSVGTRAAACTRRGGAVWSTHATVADCSGLRVDSRRCRCAEPIRR